MTTTKKSKLAAAFALATTFIIGGGLGYTIAHSTRPILVGTVLQYNTVYAGISPHTGKAMYTTLSNGPGADPEFDNTYTLKEGKDYCSALRAGGHRDWRLPDKAELNVLFGSRTMIRGFGDLSDPFNYYLSSSKDRQGHAWFQNFGDGSWEAGNRIGDPPYGLGEAEATVRCVRP